MSCPGPLLVGSNPSFLNRVFLADLDSDGDLELGYSEGVETHIWDFPLGVGRGWVQWQQRGNGANSSIQRKGETSGAHCLRLSNGSAAR